MATKPKRSDFGAGRQGAARYQQAMRTWSSSQRSTKTTNKVTGTGRSRAQRSQTTPAKTTPKKVKRQSAIQAIADYRVMGITYDPKTGRPTDVPKNRQPVKAKAPARKNVTPEPTAPKKVKAKTVAEGRITWARKYSGEKYKGTAIGKEATAYLSKQEKKKQLTKAQQSTGAKVLRKANSSIG